MSCKLMLMLHFLIYSLLFNLMIMLAQKACSKFMLLPFFDILRLNNREKQNKNIVIFFSYLLNNIPNIFVVWAKQHTGGQKKNLRKQTKQNYDEAKTHQIPCKVSWTSSFVVRPKLPQPQYSSFFLFYLFTYTSLRISAQDVYHFMVSFNFEVL